MKTLLILLFISSFSYAEYLLTFTKRNSTTVKCITYYDFADNNLYYTDSKNNRTYRQSMNQIKTFSIKSGYYLDKKDYNSCKKVESDLSSLQLDKTLSLSANNLTYLGLSDEDLNMMFALSGIFTSFLFLFGLFRWI